VGKSAPKAPDPAKTAAAQGQWNSFTAQQQQSMNMVGQNTPWGSLDYSQSGNSTIIDPNGKQITVPQYTANVSLSPSQQAIFDQTQQTEAGLARIANEQTGKIGEILNKPFEFNNQDAANWAYDLGAQRLDPRFAREEDALRTRLVNQGIRPGTAAYDAEFSSLGQNKNDAYNQLMLQGRGQAFGEATALRNQPLNEIIGLMSGTQIQNPNSSFVNAPQSQVAGVDYTGLVNQKFQADSQAHQAQMGGLFGLGASLLGAFSDVRLKIDIQRVGTLDNGLPVYIYRMSEHGPYMMGLMAHEVREVNPEAVIDDPSGFMRVRYEKAAA
jgi:hypothetical protein